LDLPPNATPEQLEVIQAYLKQQRKIQSSSGYGTRNFYKEKHEILGSKLIIYLNAQKKTDIWYMRMHVGGKQAYKRISLRTSNKSTAIERALDHWRSLRNHIDSGGSVFEKKTSEIIDKYICFLGELVATEQMKKHTLQCKKTSLKKLSVYLSPYEKPSDIPIDLFENYTIWRRTKNWTRYHKNNPKPPSDQTINRELDDFKGFFDWCSRNKYKTNNIELPRIKIDPRKYKESSPPFTQADYQVIRENLHSWIKHNEDNPKRRNNFYRRVFVHYIEILAQSGMRPHECLELRWADIGIISENQKVNFRILNEDPKLYQFHKEEMVIQIAENLSIVFKTGDMPAQNYFTMKTFNSILEALKLDKNWFEVEFVGAKIEISADTKTGRRTVYCPAGYEFQILWEYYQKESPIKPRRSDYIFQNIGTTHSKKDKHIGNKLNDTFLRRLWYEYLEYLSTKGINLNPAYTIYSCRSYFINMNLEAGNKPHQVAKMVGHSVATQSKHYEAIEVTTFASNFFRITDNQVKQPKIKASFVDEE
jgi:integrase